MPEQNFNGLSKIIAPYEFLERKRLIFPEGNASAREMYEELKDNTTTEYSLKNKSGDVRQNYRRYFSLVGKKISQTDLIVTGMHNVGGMALLYQVSLPPVACASQKHKGIEKQKIQNDFDNIPWNEFSERYQINFSDTLYLAKCILMSKKPKNAGSEEFEQRFLREARVMKEIDHPNIPKAIYSDKNVIALKYIPYTMPIEDLRPEHRSLEERLIIGENTVKIFADINKKRDEEGKRRIDHRDITGRNILIMREDIPDLSAYAVDLGLVSNPDDPLPTASKEQRFVTGGTLIGTPSYIPPEVALAGDLKVYTSDVYSLGVVLYSLLTGDMPFKGDNYNEILANIVTWNQGKGITPPHFIDKRIPLPLSLLVMKSLSRLPGERYSDVIEFYEAIKTVRDSVVFPKSISAGVVSDESMKGLPTLVVSEKARREMERKERQSREKNRIKRELKGELSGEENLRTMVIGSSEDSKDYENQPKYEKLTSKKAIEEKLKSEEENNS